MPIDLQMPTFGLDDLAPGDILLSYVDGEESADHSLIWTAAPLKPLAHCVDQGNFNGAFAESGRRLERRVNGPFKVLRPNNPELGGQAARVAALWAVFAEADEELQGKLPTPYSQDRLIAAHNDPWDSEAYVRSVRAYCRADLARWRADDHYQPKAAVLSEDKGVTCSQFVTYAYQAGAIALTLADIRNSALRSLIFLMDQHEWFDDIKKRGRYATLGERLAPYEDRLTEFMPAAIHVDAKTRTVRGMERDLIADQQGFTYVANVVGT